MDIHRIFVEEFNDYISEEEYKSEVLLNNKVVKIENLHKESSPLYTELFDLMRSKGISEMNIVELEKFLKGETIIRKITTTEYFHAKPHEYIKELFNKPSDYILSLLGKSENVYFQKGNSIIRKEDVMNFPDNYKKLKDKYLKEL